MIVNVLTRALNHRFQHTIADGPNADNRNCPEEITEAPNLEPDTASISAECTAHGGNFARADVNIAASGALVAMMTRVEHRMDTLEAKLDRVLELLEGGSTHG